ncbi:MAG: S-layer homology domain-containing protein, partial [Oscillospiraceae bacterium]|nr:S-layer homology domain-containing protein [Oscillospiraceae bacterium]
PTGGTGFWPPPPTPPVTEILQEDVPLAGPSGFASFIEGFPDDTFRGANRISREEFVTILFRLQNPGGVPNGGAPTAQTFTDVSPERWSFDAIEWAVAEGIVEVGADGLFFPRTELTRGELAVMLVRAEGWTDTAEDTFTDIEEHSKSGYILKAVYEGIFEGFPDGTFRPDATATRFEMVTALVRYALGVPVTDEKIEGLDFTLTDVPRTHWAFRYVVLATAGFEAGLEMQD